MNQYSSRSIQYSIPILVKILQIPNTSILFLHFESIENTNTITNTQYFHFLIWQCFLVDIHIFINKTVPISCTIEI